MKDRSPEAWLFYPEASGRSIGDSINAKCAELGWTYHERPTFEFHMSNGRPIQKVNPEDATNLYRSIHTRRIGVWQVGKANAPVRPNPGHNPKHYVPLSRFVQYKAFHCRIDPGKFDEHWEKSATAFRSWIDAIRCEGEGDPRCLPFHVFESDLNRYDLDIQEGRRQFNSDHGRQSSRLDVSGLRWDRPPANRMHGQPVLQIAGRDLVRGFHWDVSSSRKNPQIVTTSEIWKIKRNGYVNIYPNAHIRGSNAASRIYPRRKQKPA